MQHSTAARYAVAATVGALLGTLGLVSPAAADTTTASSLLARVAQAGESSSAYSRDYFRHWIDADGDGCDTRQEVLIAESLVPVTYGTGCDVTAGQWTSYYDGAVWTDPADVDVDHTVALHEAWQSGAHAWSAQQRQEYANDLTLADALVAVTDDVNASKGSRDPAEWLPPAGGAATCDFAVAWTQVKYRWSLTVDPAEHSALQDVLSGSCGATVVEVPARTDTVTTSRDTLTAAATLAAGQQITSSNGSHRFVMQGDGNAVLYGPQGAVWSTGTFGSGSGITMQGDGNLVVYRSGVPVWNSRTTNRPGAILRVQDDGNLVIYQGGAPVWAVSWLVAGPPPAPPMDQVRTTLTGGEQLTAGQQLLSADGTRKLIMQTDGNAVVYGPQVRWHANTQGVGNRLVLQTDGNLVVYNSSGHPLWNAGTPGLGVVQLVMQSDANLVLYRADGQPVWSSLHGRFGAPPTTTTPPNPGNSVNCTDFATWTDAQAWFDRHYPHYGDVAGLDSDGDRLACESLPGAP